MLSLAIKAYKNWFDPIFLNYLKEFYETELKRIYR